MGCLEISLVLNGWLITTQAYKNSFNLSSPYFYPILPYCIMKLTVSVKIYAPLSHVRNCMRNPEHITHRAFADAATRHCPWAKWSEPTVGETFTTRMEARDGSFWFDLVGQYTAVDAIHSFSYIMWSYERDTDFVPAGRMVDVMFEEDGSCGCVTVTEVFDAEDVHDADMQVAGRQSILENFKKHVEQK